MEKDVRQELDALRLQISQLQETLLKVAPAHMGGEQQRTGIQPMKNAHPDARISALFEELCLKAEQDGDKGAITYLGVFASGNRQSNWVRNEVSANDLLRLITNNLASKVLACIGSQERLKMLLALLDGPKNVAQLVDVCGYTSSGQVYHHLRPLLTADLVMEDEHSRGVYHMTPHRVQGLIMLLAGISDMVDPKYTQGEWGSEQPERANPVM